MIGRERERESLEVEEGEFGAEVNSRVDAFLSIETGCDLEHYIITADDYCPGGRRI